MTHIGRDDGEVRRRHTAALVLLGSAAGAAMTMTLLATAPTAHADCGGSLTPAVLEEVDAMGGIDNVSPVELARLTGDTTQTVPCLIDVGEQTHYQEFTHLADVNSHMTPTLFGIVPGGYSGDDSMSPTIAVDQMAAGLAINVQEHPAEASFVSTLATLYLGDIGDGPPPGASGIGVEQYDTNVGALEEMLQADVYRVGPQLYSTPIEKELATNLADVWNAANADYDNPYDIPIPYSQVPISQQVHNYVSDYFVNDLHENSLNTTVQDTIQTVWQDIMIYHDMTSEVFYDGP